MRVVNGIMCVVLIAFAGVQYNDPDAYFWIPVYVIPAAWAALASWRPQRLVDSGVLALLGLSVLAAIVGTVWFWPEEPAFWQREVWWESEPAREGMGMMVATLALALVAVAAIGARRRGGAA